MGERTIFDPITNRQLLAPNYTEADLQQLIDVGVMGQLIKRDSEDLYSVRMFAVRPWHVLVFLLPLIVFAALMIYRQSSNALEALVIGTVGCGAAMALAIITHHIMPYEDCGIPFFCPRSQKRSAQSTAVVHVLPDARHLLLSRSGRNLEGKQHSLSDEFRGTKRHHDE